MVARNMVARNPVAVAARGKGMARLARRAVAIAGGYGLGPRRMQRRLATVLELLEPYGCPATLPITAAAAARNPGAVAWHASRGIEFAVHGYHHVDHTLLTAAEQHSQVGAARRVLARLGLGVAGFRAPYLRWNESTVEAVRAAGFLYDSSQGACWPLEEALETAAYRRMLAFCSPLPAATHPVLPRLERGLVRIPYCLPDDESVVDRLRLEPGATRDVWLGMLRATHDRGELLNLGVHPERIEACSTAIVAVLERARAARPGVWMARLEDIARWWLARAAATVGVTDLGGHRYAVDVSGPDGVRVLARDLEAEAGSEPWAGRYTLLAAERCVVRAARKPVLGVHPSSDPALVGFLREQGYVAEPAEAGGAHAAFLKRERFGRADELGLLAELEQGVFPLVRLGRWPGGARSAFCLTGDVDALTIGDFALRLAGR
jgi:hypothetical protein